MNILDNIIDHKKEEVEVRKIMVPVEELRDSEYFDRKCLSLKDALLSPHATGIIAEFKRRSPSKGIINATADVSEVTAAYTTFGASGLSVLTDHHFFGGTIDDLVNARKNHIPILRKDFTIDPYQLTAAKAIGADVILLIAACLSRLQVQELAGAAKALGMEIILELHEAEETMHICDDIDMVGINNRSLKTFKVDIGRSLELSRSLPEEKVKIAESGISDPATIAVFRAAGYKGFLIGENFMKKDDPGKAFEEFIKNIK